MTKNKETRYISSKELRAVQNDDGSRSLRGYAAVFDSPSVDMGGWKEIIAPGCFTKTLLDENDVVCLRDHDNSILLGRTRSKTLTLEQDSVGLKFNCSLPQTTQASDLIALIERGDIDGCSFSFVANMDDWKNNPDGTLTRTVIQADLFDVSVVSEPAYPDTSVALRSAPVEFRSAIENRDKTEKRDDVAPAEEASMGSDCDCPCPECVDGDCEDCTDIDCDCEFCSCDASTEQFRNRVHITLELAKLTSK